MKAYIENGYIVYVSDTLGNTELTQEEYLAISEKLNNIPQASEGYSCRLRADNLEWELYELESMEGDGDAGE